MTTLGRLELVTLNDGVLLLEFIPNDARPLFELIDKNRDHLSQWDDETAAKYPDFESVLCSITHPKDPTKVRLGIWYEGVLAGTINLTHKSALTVEIGFWVGSEFGGIGLATIATRAMIDHVFHLTFVDRLIASARVENIASQKVLKRAGLEENHRDDKQVHFVHNVES